MPGNVEYSLVAVTADLHQLARDFHAIAGELWAESRRWAYLPGRGRWERAATGCEVLSQRCAIDAVTGGQWERLDAVTRATEQLRAARLTLHIAVQQGELFNAHRVAPIPARLFEPPEPLAWGSGKREST